MQNTETDNPNQLVSEEKPEDQPKVVSAANGNSCLWLKYFAWLITMSLVCCLGIYCFIGLIGLFPWIVALAFWKKILLCAITVLLGAAVEFSVYFKNISDFIKNMQDKKYWGEGDNENKVKKTLSSGFFVISVTAGVMVAATQYVALHEFLIFWGIVTIPAFPWVVIIFAMVLTVIGATMFIQNSAMRSIQKFEDELAKLKEFIFGDNQDVRSCWSWVSFGLSILFLIGFFCTIAFSAVANITTSLSYVLQLPVMMIHFFMSPIVIAAIIGVISALASIACDLINSLDSLKALQRLFKKIQDRSSVFHQPKPKCVAHNPIIFLHQITINICWKLLFLIHIVFMGLTSDILWRIPKWVCIVLSAFSEFLQDLSYFTDDDHDHHHGCAESGHNHNILHIIGIIVLFPLEFLAFVSYVCYQKADSQQLWTITESGQRLLTSGEAGVAECKMEKYFPVINFFLSIFSVDPLAQEKESTHGGGCCSNKGHCHA